MKHHYQAVVNTTGIFNYKKFLVNHEIKNNTKKFATLKYEKQKLETEIESHIIDKTKWPILNHIKKIIDNHNIVSKARITN